MRKMLNVVFAAGSIAATTGLLATTEYLPIDHVYTIKGFDNNDNSEVMIEGYLPDLCYQTPIAKARVIGKKVIVDVTGTRDSNPDRICAQMTVPFLTTVHVGVLDTGAYDVIVNGASGSATRATLNIVESSSSAIDNYIYANVEYVEKDGYDGKIQLKGYNPSDCLELDRVEFVSNELDSYAVLPIMKKVRESCPMKMMPFSYETEVPNDLSRDKVLLHVRVMNGKSVNTIYSAM